jgi:hypothetical protein
VGGGEEQMHNVDYDPGPWRQTLSLPPGPNPSRMRHRQALYLKSYLDSLYQCCGSGMFIPDPVSWFLAIPDHGSKNSNKREGWKKMCCHNFLCSHKFHKIANYFSFELLKKKIWANFQRILEHFNQNCQYVLKNMGLGSRIRDPGSGKNLFRIPESKRHRIPDPQHWLILWVAGGDMH